MTRAVIYYPPIFHAPNFFIPGCAPATHRCSFHCIHRNWPRATWNGESHHPMSLAQEGLLLFKTSSCLNLPFQNISQFSYDILVMQQVCYKQARMDQTLTCIILITITASISTLWDFSYQCVEDYPTLVEICN